MTIHQCVGKYRTCLAYCTIVNHSMFDGRQEYVYDRESGHIGCEDGGSGLSAKEFFGPRHRERSDCVRVSVWQMAEYGGTPTCCK